MMIRSNFTSESDRLYRSVIYFKLRIMFCFSFILSFFFFFLSVSLSFYLSAVSFSLSLFLFFSICLFLSSLWLSLSKSVCLSLSLSLPHSLSLYLSRHLCCMLNVICNVLKEHFSLKLFVIHIEIYTTVIHHNIPVYRTGTLRKYRSKNRYEICTGFQPYQIDFTQYIQ